MRYPAMHSRAITLSVYEEELAAAVYCRLYLGLLSFRWQIYKTAQFVQYANHACTTVVRACSGISTRIRCETYDAVILSVTSQWPSVRRVRIPAQVAVYVLRTQSRGKRLYCPLTVELLLLLVQGKTFLPLLLPCCELYLLQRAMRSSLQPSLRAVILHACSI